MFNHNEVFNQLVQCSKRSNGANVLKVMTGAKDLMYGEDHISFKLPRVHNGINYIKITLTPSDLYDVEFGKISNKQCPNMKELGLKVRIPSYDVKETVEMVYGEQLKELFESKTGLYLSL